MERENFKSKLILVLFIISIILLLTSVSIEYLKKSDDGKEKVKSASIAQLNELFDRVLHDNGIEADWVNIRKAGGKFDSLEVVYQVDVPADKPIILIIKDLNSHLYLNHSKLVSKEFEINGKTEITVLSEDVIKLKAVLAHSKKLQIVKPNLGFILATYGELNESQRNRILEIQQPFAISIVPSVEGKEQLNLLAQNEKEYTLLISDNISDSKYLIETGETKKEISEAVGRILSDFNKPVICLIDEESQIYKSAVYNFIRDEFSKREFPLKKLSEIELIEAKEDQNLVSIFDFKVNLLNKDAVKTFRISAMDFLSLQNEIQKLTKRGFKIIFPSVSVN